MVDTGASCSAERTLFSALRSLSRGMAIEGRANERRFRHDLFEHLTDHLAIVTPGQRFGDSRFEFFGAALAENSPRGDLSGASFGDLMNDPYYRRCLAGFAHVARVGQPHVTRDHPVAGGGSAYFTRLLIPLFSGCNTVRILCAALLHDRLLLPPPAPEPASFGRFATGRFATGDGMGAAAGA